MFKLTRSLLALNRPKLNSLRCTSSGSDNVNVRLNKVQKELIRKDDFIDEQIEFDNELTSQAYKNELNEFKNDLQTLTLSECLKKYECTIEDALKLNPEEQKRIIIKGLVIARFKTLKAGRVKLKVLDTNTFDEITVMMPDHVYNMYDEILNVGSSVVFTGLVFVNREKKTNSLYCDKIAYVNQTSITYVNKLYKPEYTIMDWFNLRNYPSMKFRSRRVAALIKLRSALINQIHKLMTEEQFVHVTPPILTSWPLMGDDCFLAKNNKREDYFCSDVYLAKESDKHLESIVNAIPQIYTITHSFTADDRRSKQVANEKLMLEVAQSTDDTIDDLMNQVEYFVKKLTSSYASLHPRLITLLKGERGLKADFRLENLDFNYIRMTYEESIELLKRKEIDLPYGEHLTLYHKKIISDYFEKYPVFIYNFPYELHNDFDTLEIDQKAQRFELLIGLGLSAGKGKIKSKELSNEISDKLKQLNCDVSQENIGWYLDLKQKGSVPSTWFSLSIDLYMMAFFDLPSLRDTILFPRVPNYCEM